MERYHDRILISNKSGKSYLPEINNFNRERGLLGIDNVPIGEKTLWPFGDQQISIDYRYNQMKNKTILKTYRGIKSTTKEYIIKSITEYSMYGVPKKFNKYMTLLERVF